jgi:hypothetical protein
MTGASSIWPHALCGLPSSSASATKIVSSGSPHSDKKLEEEELRRRAAYVARYASTPISSGQVLPCRIMMILIILVVSERHNAFCFWLILQTNGAPAVVGDVPIEVDRQNGAFCFAEPKRCGLERGQRRLPAQRLEAQVRNWTAARRP